MKRLKELWKNIQVNDDNSDDKPIRLKSLLTGELLVHGFMRKQYRLLLLIALLFFLYINNGYSSQRQQYHIMQLQDELTIARIKALTVASQYTTLCRESNLMEMLHAHNIDLKQSNEPVIRIDD